MKFAVDPDYSFGSVGRRRLLRRWTTRRRGDSAGLILLILLIMAPYWPSLAGLNTSRQSGKVIYFEVMMMMCMRHSW